MKAKHLLHYQKISDNDIYKTSKNRKPMKTKTICFHIKPEDRKLVEEFAKQERLSVSSFCRITILNKILSKRDDDAPTKIG